MRYSPLLLAAALTLSTNVASHADNGDHAAVQVSPTNRLVPQSGPTIAGTVREPDGAPVVNAHVEIYEMPATKRASLPVSKETYTKSNGAFRVSGLPEGRYRVNILEPRSYEENRVTLSNVAAGTEDLVVTLGRKILLPVRVKGTDGQPVTGAVLRVERVRQHVFQPGERQTDADGLFKLELRQGARYKITATTPLLQAVRNIVDLSDNAEPPAELVLTLAPCPVVTGKVVDVSGKPKPNVFVTLDQMDLYDFDQKRRGKTDAQGLFKIDNAEPGAGTLMVHADEDRAILLASQPLLIWREKPLAEVRIQLPRTGTVRGVVRNKTGEPVVDTLSLFNKIGVRQRSAFQSKTESNGNYQFEQVMPGSYMLTSEYLEKESTSPQMRHIEVKEGETAVADFPVPSKVKIIITGKATLAGKPLTDVSINLLPLFANGAFDFWATDLKPVKSDATGRFAIGYANPGPHLLLVGKDGSGIVFGDQIEIGAGQTNLDVEIKGGTLKGIVEDSIGNPVGGARIKLNPIGGAMAKQWFMTRQLNCDAKGRFEAEHLTLEPYRVMASDDSGKNIAQVELMPSANATEHRIRLKPGLRINGQVGQEMGGPVRGARLKLITEDARSLDGISVNADGEYGVTPTVPPGKYYLICHHPILSTEVVPLDLTNDVTCDFTLKAAGELQVELRGDEKVIAGRIIRIADVRGKEVHRVKLSSTMAGTLGVSSATLTPTDEKGRTLIKGLPVGDYTVSVEGTASSAKVTVTSLQTVTTVIAIAQ